MIKEGDYNGGSTSANNSGNTHKYMDENYCLYSFKDVFIKSKVIEKIVESVILDPDLPSESELWELFGLCLIGDENTHYQLIHTIRRVGDLIKGKKGGYWDYMIKVVVELVSEFKVKPDQQKQLMTTLSTIDKKILETLEMLGKHGKKETLEQKAQHASNLVTLCQEKRNILLSCAKKSTVDSPHSEANIEAVFNQLQSSVSLPAQLQKLEKERKKTEAQYTQDLSQVADNIKDLNAKERQLLARKKELEEELQRVNQGIEAIAQQRQPLLQQKKGFEDMLLSVKKAYDQKSEELRNLAEINKEERGNLLKLKEYIKKTKSVLESTLGRRSDVMELQLQQCTMQLIEKIGTYLEYQQQRLLDVLTRKISSYCEKLNNYRLKRDQERKLNTKNSNAKAEDIERNMMRCYKSYIKYAKLAEQILQTAEELRQITPEFDNLYIYQVKKHIHPVLDIMSKSQAMFFEFNERLLWCKDATYLPRTTSKSDLNYDTDASEFSIPPPASSIVADEFTPGMHAQQSSLHSSVSSVEQGPSGQDPFYDLPPQPASLPAEAESGDEEAAQQTANNKQQQQGKKKKKRSKKKQQ